MAGVIQTPERDDWGTPDWLVTAAWLGLCGRIDLDPCGNPARPLPSVMHTIYPPGDGLSEPWNGLNVFVNPPYGPPLGEWLHKCAVEGNSRKANVVALVPSVTSRRAWQATVALSACVCFLNKRVVFHGAKYGAAFPSAVVLWTKDKSIIKRFKATFKAHGMLLVPA